MMDSVLRLTPHAGGVRVPVARTHIRWYKIRSAPGRPAAPPRAGVIRLFPMPGASGLPGRASSDTPTTGSCDAALVRVVLRAHVEASPAGYIPLVPWWSLLVPQLAHTQYAR